MQALERQFCGDEYSISYGREFKFKARKARIKVVPQLKARHGCEIALEPSKAKVFTIISQLLVSHGVIIDYYTRSRNLKSTFGVLGWDMRH